MCLQPFKIKSVNPIAPNLAYVPCGKCKQCRQSIKNSWSMRLALELETCQRKGWKVGFCTLTYDDEHLPRFSPDALDRSKYDLVPSDLPTCFDKKQLRDFIVNIRRDLDSEYNVHGLKYMVCSEYGSHTQRPHYHCIFSWPECVLDDASNVVGGCPPIDFFALIKKYWTFGFVFPKDFNGGRDRKGYQHQPFIVTGSARFAGAYAGKYCCKDLDFVKSLKGFKFDKKSPAFKNGDCFHIQNKSLGLSWLVGKSDDDLSRYLFKGVGFAGDEKLHQLPLYLRNKLFFSPLYIVDRKVYDGVRLVRDSSFTSRSDSELESIGFRVEYKRLVRRESTKFFRKFKNEIFERKVKFWSSQFQKLCSADSLSSLSFPPGSFNGLTYEKLSSELDGLRSGVSFDVIARFYVSRFGLPLKYQYDCDDVDLWSFRYTLNKVPEVFGRCSLISKYEVEFYTNLCSVYLGYLGFSCPVDSDLDIRVDKLRDRCKHME